ncbi:MAG: type II toxin-antitoxin system VapC family toxin [Gammaproteobacteria bacterium]|nr:type II toxin-antitoxin system VapC family toxin [Gammaproteobacteria bacterium]
MIYCDSSALVKLYVEEPHSEWLRRQLPDKTALAASRVAMPEVISAFTRRLHQGELTEAQIKTFQKAFLSDWENLNVLEFDERKAAALVSRHRLHGFDAVHLSSALILQGEMDISLYFVAFDNSLLQAARAEGLMLLHPELSRMH